MKANHLSLGVEERKRGAPVSIARLTHRSRIDQISSRRLQLQRDRFRLSHSAILGAKSVGRCSVGKESALKMRVAEKSQRHGFAYERRERVAHRHDIFVLIIRLTMHQLHARELRKLNLTMRQGAQPL